MEVNNLEQAQKEIIKNIKLLLNSKFESKENLIINHSNTMLYLKREHLLSIFNETLEKKNIRKYVKEHSKDNNLILIDCGKGIFITSARRFLE